MEADFLKIVDDNQGIIYKVCKLYRDTKEDQEDLFQEIVLQLWKAFPNFRGEAKVSSWIYRIALNTAMALYRKNTVKLEFSDTPPPSPPTSDDRSENEERLFEALRQLRQTDRALIALFLDGYAYREIAGIMGITENNVGVKISRIKEKLKQLLNT